jgi:SAM-dependent methyltransferase
MRVEKEINFFDRFEAEHGDYDVLAEASYGRILNTLARRMSVRPGMRCLDLGCGTGAFTRRLQPLGFFLTGLDISPRSINRAKSLGGAEYVVGDITACPLPTSSYDVVVMSGVLHHIFSTDVRVQSLREAWRMLKPGGHFFSYDPNAWSPSMFLYRDPRSPFYTQAGKTDNEILLSRHQIGGELAAADFKEIRVTGLSGIKYRYVEGRLSRKLLPLYNLFYEPLIRWSPFENLLGTFLIATAVKPGSSKQKIPPMP